MHLFLDESKRRHSMVHKCCLGMKLDVFDFIGGSLWQEYYILCGPERDLRIIVMGHEVTLTTQCYHWHWMLMVYIVCFWVYTEEKQHAHMFCSVTFESAIILKGRIWRISKVSGYKREVVFNFKVRGNRSGRRVYFLHLCSFKWGK